MTRSMSCRTCGCAATAEAARHAHSLRSALSGSSRAAPPPSRPSFTQRFCLTRRTFRFSDERAEIVKILNNGNVRGLPVLRTMMNREREFNPQAFQVFGPKIVATRSSYDDKGLESRFLTQEMGSRRLRHDIPINLPN